MPIERMLRDVAFEPGAVKALSDVYDDIVNALCSGRRNYPAPETVGAMIIKQARRGHDPVKVRDIVLKKLRTQ